MSESMPDLKDAMVRLLKDDMSGRDFLRGYMRTVVGLASTLDLEAVERLGEMLDDTCRKGRTVFCVGNGGSAATASHFSTDLSWGRRTAGEERPKVVSLTSNSPIMTALANDVGYANVFAEQLRGLFEDGDVVFAISASGNSENVLRAVQYANEHGGVSLGLVGFDGGGLKSACHACVHVETPAGMYELVEDMHHAVCHMLASYQKRKAAHRASDGG